VGLVDDEEHGEAALGGEANDFLLDRTERHRA
jgi:hypothetical protein